MKNIFTLIMMLASLGMQSQAWTNYTTADGLIEGIPSSLIQDTDGNIWTTDWTVNTSPGIGNFDGVSWVTLGTDDGAPTNAIADSFQDSDGNYWFTTFDEMGVSKYDGSTWTSYTVADGLVSNTIWETFQDSQGDLWFTGFGISRFDGTTFTNYTTIDGEIFFSETMVEDNEGNFWFASSLGLLKFDGTDWEVFTSADGYSTDRPGALLYDSNGNLWVGSYLNGTGIDRFDGTTVTNYSFGDGINNVDVRYSNAMAEGSDGTIYIGTNFGVAVFDGTDWTSIALAEGLPQENVRSVIEDTEGNLWISTFIGVSKYNPTLGVFETLQESFQVYPNPSNSIINIASEAQIETVQLYSLLGEKVLEKNLTENASIDVSALSTGTYILKVIDSNELVGFKKIIIE
ncbi:MAG: T9SS type A sorting domain-containing protein [Flavobacteriaceae bacterium]|nr:T9SS type A sorting domain-containing protein [Flavobacteriaceae bacterium]